MTYTNRDFATGLAQELDKGFDIIRLSRWAYATYLRHARELEEGLSDMMMQVIAMEEGPEFEFVEEELRDFVKCLLSPR